MIVIIVNLLWADSQIRCAPYDDDAKARLMMPLNTHVWLRDKLLDRSLCSAFTPLFHGGQASRVGVYGPGRHEIVSPDGETMLWQLATTGPRVSSCCMLLALLLTRVRLLSSRVPLLACDCFPRPASLTTRRCERTIASFYPRIRGKAF